MTTPTPDLYALIIRIIAGRNGRLRATQGHLAHAAFLNILRQVDPAVAQALHDLPGRKPFTISPIEGLGHGRGGQIHVQAGQEGQLRITLLDSQLFQTFITYFLQGPPQLHLTLAEMLFHISEVLGTAGSHPVAGTGNLQMLADHWNAVTLSPDLLTINLRFRSPTAFSLRNGRTRYMHVLPDPVLIFGELARYWDNLTGSATQEIVRQESAFGVAVARHDIKTHMYQFRNSKQVGFTGSVRFRILDKENELLIRHLNRLADLAFFTGIGYKTTMGMGQVNRA